MTSLRTALPAALAAAALAASSFVGHLATAQAAPTSPAGDEQEITSVLAISVDGLNPQALGRLGKRRTPHIHAMAKAGASTLNARTLVEQTVTLPNHTGMVTGRRIDASLGGHGVTWNDDRKRPATVQTAAGTPVDSVFTAVDAVNGDPALFASKTKFSLWTRSWPAAIDKTVIRKDNQQLVRRLEKDLESRTRAFRILHLSAPDTAGHAHGFMSKRYLRAVRQVDRLVGQAIEAVTSSPELADTTAIILTSDHGGRGARHGVATSVHNYRVPFMVQGPGIIAGTDLYDLNPDYDEPGRRQPGYAQERQPIRNAALANLALDLLGLGPVPDSEINVAQDLDVTPPAP